MALDRWSPLTPEGEEELAAKGRIWIFACLVAGALSAGFGAYRCIAGDTVRGVLDFMVGVAFVWSARDLVRSGRIYRSVAISTGASLFALIPAVLFGDSMGAVTFAWYGMLPLVGALAVGRTALAVLAGVVLPLPFLPFLLHTLGFAAPASTDATTAVAIAIAFAGMGALNLGHQMLQQDAEDERDKARSKLRELEQQTEDLLSARDQFVRNVSHEIRTPLNHILGATQLLKSTELDGDQEELVNLAGNSGGELLELIDEALIVHDLEKGDVRLEKLPFDTEALFSSIAEKFSGPMKAKGLNFALQMDSDLPEQLVGDTKAVNQLVSNLVENAMAFTDKGRVNVRVSFDRENGLRLEVEDTGVGIPPEHQRRVFEAYHQVDPSDQRKHGGLGTGLAVSQNLAQLMGGEISVKSEVGFGSTFSVTMGMNPPRPGQVYKPLEQRTPIDDDETTARPREERILLAEPSRRSLSAFIGTLNKMGLRPDGVSTVQEMLDALKYGQYDVVFVAAELARDESTLQQLTHAQRSGAFIVRLNSPDSVDLPPFKRPGFNDEVPKPLRREQVIEMLKQAAG